MQDDQIAALKSGNKKVLETLRYILAQIKNKEIDKRSELNEEETTDMLRKHVKTLNESIEAFKKGEREDLVKEYEEQKEIISRYLPAEMNDEDLQKEVRKIIDSNQDVYNQNPKMIIGLCMKELKSKADPQRIMKILNAIIST